MKLTAGLIGKSVEWEIILNQIGINFEPVKYAAILSNYPVLIIFDNNSKFDNNEIFKFINNGGSVLTTASNAKSIFGLGNSKRFVSYCKSNQGIFSDVGICDIYNSLIVTDKANDLEDHSGKGIIYVGKIGSGNVVVIPDGFIESCFKVKTVRKNFISKYSERFPNERVSQVSKSEIASVIRRSLEHLYNSAGFPFVHLWFFPNGEKTIFNFRIDTDFGTEREVFDLYQVLDRNEVPGTWFIEVKSKEKWLSKFSQFKDQELAYHCYRHRMTKNKIQNVLDFEKGRKLLVENGIKAKGYAAPYGEWSTNIGELAEKFDFQYSSEFGYAYDGLPFYPILSGRRSCVLQIPVHPISTNRLKHAGTDSENLISYFVNLIENKIKNMEPLFFYTHPFEIEYDFFDSLFSEVNERGIYKTTLHEFSNWWKDRLNKNWKIEYENGNLVIDTDDIDNSFFLRIIKPNGEQFLAPLKSGAVGENNIELKRTDPKKIEVDYDQLRKYTFKMFKHDILFNMRKMQQ